MSPVSYAFYITICVGNVILASEWAKYGLLECTVKNGRVVLGLILNVVAVFISSVSDNFSSNSNATVIVVGVAVVTFFVARKTLPPGRFAYNKASKRILHWYPTHFTAGKILETGKMLKTFPLGQKTVKLLQTSIANMPKDSTINSRLELALTHEWLGVLYRMMNEFEKAEKEFTTGLGILENLISQCPENKRAKDALGHVLFRLGELEHIHKRYQSASALYKKSLAIDKPLGLEVRADITRKLLHQVSLKTS